VSHIDLDELKARVFFGTATQDDRYVWEKIPGSELDALGISDGLDRYRITGCAHPEAYRSGNRCTHCGGQNPYEPPAAEAARKRRGRK
jgi:hypothetical protein